MSRPSWKEVVTIISLVVVLFFLITAPHMGKVDSAATQEPVKTLHATEYRLENYRVSVYEFHMDDKTRCIFIRGSNVLQCDFGGAE